MQVLESLTTTHNKKLCKCTSSMVLLWHIHVCMYEWYHQLHCKLYKISTLYVNTLLVITHTLIHCLISPYAYTSPHLYQSYNALMPVLQILLIYHYVGGECLDGDTHIFIGNNNSIEKSLYNNDTKLSWETLITKRSQPLGIDVDLDSCILFYSLGNKDIKARVGVIHAISLTNNSSRILHSDLGNPLQVAVNWITKKLYWCDSTLSTIEYSDYDGDNQEVLLNVSGVEAITLDPCANEIYWISDNSISKMKLDGTNKPVIVSSGIEAPNFVVIDHVSSKLYWTDGSDIQTSNLDGDNLSTVYTTNARRPTGITVYHNTLYWAEWSKKRIATCSTDGRNKQILVNNVTQTAAIHIMDRSKQTRYCEYNILILTIQNIFSVRDKN